MPPCRHRRWFSALRKLLTLLARDLALDGVPLEKNSHARRAIARRRVLVAHRRWPAAADAQVPIHCRGLTSRAYVERAAG
jgi:hypothetical protein